MKEATAETDLDSDDPTAVRDLKKLLKEIDQNVDEKLRKLTETWRKAAASEPPPCPEPMKENGGPKK